jgi:hypothetical protein
MIMRSDVDPSFPRGRLMGRVFSAATQLPLASVEIELQPVGPSASGVTRIGRVAESDAEGCFEANSIPVGTYYAVATLPGYVSSASILGRPPMIFGSPNRLAAFGDIPEAIVPRVTIEAERDAVIDFQLELEGAISGKVTWMDGSPARDNILDLVLIQSNGSPRHYDPNPGGGWLSSGPGMLITDGKGNFRLSNLPAGKYAVGARVPRFLPYVRTDGDPSIGPTTVNCLSSFYWTGGTAYFREASAVEVENGADTSGVDLVLPMTEPPPLVLPAAKESAGQPESQSSTGFFLRAFSGEMKDKKD